MKRGTTVYLYELAWILPSVAIPVGMLVALLVTAFGVGVHLPSNVGQINATKVAETPPFDQPGVVRTGPNQFEVRMVAQVWSFAPNEIRVPAGSTVTFIATSRDVTHGLLIHSHNVNIMLIPGQISRVTARFDRPGEYPFVCHEYCGIAHHVMWGKVIVSPEGVAPAKMALEQ